MPAPKQGAEVLVRLRAVYPAGPGGYVYAIPQGANGAAEILVYIPNDRYAGPLTEARPPA